LGNKVPLFAAVGAAVLIAVVAYAMMQAPTEPKTVQMSAYVQMNQDLKQSLSAHNITMSSPIKLKEKSDIEKYCTLFADAERQGMIEYCTSTELTVGNDFVGNIHMVGLADDPKVVLVLLQADSSMSNMRLINSIFDVTIDGVVCPCWEDVTPDGFSSTSAWVEGLQQFHLSDTKPHSKSKQLSLYGKTLQLELTENSGGYVWQLFIYL